MKSLSFFQGRHERRNPRSFVLEGYSVGSKDNAAMIGRPEREGKNLPWGMPIFLWILS
jgi:hypothetical protein